MKFLGFVCLFVVMGESVGVKNFTPCPQVKLKFGRVRYRQRGRFIKFTCNTGYVMAGEKYSTCVQGEWDNPIPKCVRPTCLKVKPPVNGLIYPSHGGGVLNFYCMPGFEIRGHPVVFCDGRRWDNNSPICLPTNTKPALSCDFETEDLCGWTHDFNHDFDWRRLNFQTPSGSIGTGPSYDHTKGENDDGYYMYIESSSRNENDVARLVSPLYDKTSTNTCFEFYYHMFGATIGELRVYLKKVSQDWYLDPSTAFFLKKGNQGDHWYRSITELGPISEDFQVIIEGVRGSGYVSDIAIDDVKLIPDCNINEVSTSTEFFDTEEPLVIESCENRCDEGSYNSTTVSFHQAKHEIACDCDSECYYRSRCCPDYFDFCIGAPVTDDEYTTDMEHSTESSEHYKTTKYLMPTTPQTTLFAQIRPSTSIPQKVTDSADTSNHPTKIIETTKEVIFETITPRIITQMVTQEQEMKSPTTKSNIRTTVKAKTQPPAITTDDNNNINQRLETKINKVKTTHKIENYTPTTERTVLMHISKTVSPKTSKSATTVTKHKESITTLIPRIETITTTTARAYTISNPNTPYNEKINTNNESDEVELLPSDTDKGIIITVLPNDEEKQEKRIEQEVENEINKNFFSRGSKEEIIMKNQEAGLKHLNVIIGCIALLMILVIVGIVVGYKRYRTIPMRLNRMTRCGRRGSQNEVLFRASDEQLDFGLNYDEL